jgi:Na+/proline symporter
VGSGFVVILQFLLFLLVGTAIWSAGLAPDELAADAIFPRFIIEHLPVGIAGLVVAGILAAAMSTIASSINALASSITHDIYAGWTGRRDPAHLYRIGRAFSAGWGLALIGGALLFESYASGNDTPVVVLALSIASITYGALLGTYLLAARWPRATGRDVVGAVAVTVAVMLVVVFARQLAVGGVDWLGPVGRLAWPWYVPLGTTLAFFTGVALSYFPSGERPTGNLESPERSR